MANMTMRDCEAFELVVPRPESEKNRLTNNGSDGHTGTKIPVSVHDLEQTTTDDLDETSQILTISESVVGEGGRQRGGCPCVKEPEGRDAWVVAAVSFFITFCLSTEYGCFGIYYPEYIKIFNTSAASVGWIKGIQGAAGGLFGLVTSSLVKVYGAKLTCCAAGVCLMVGYLGASLSPNIYVSYLTQGAIAGIGVNMATTAVLVIIQQHFTRNGVIGSGISFAGYALGHFSAGLITSDLISAFGTRGALLMHSAIFAHVIPLALMLRNPPKPNKMLQRTGKVNDKELSDRPTRHRLGRELCDFSLLTEPLFVCTAFSALLLFYTTSSFVSHLPSRAIHYGVPMRDAAILYTTMGIAAIVGRTTSTLVGNLPRVDIGVYYALVAAIMATGPLTYAFLTSYETLFLSPILFGIGMSSVMTVFVVVLVKMFKVERLPRAIALYHIASHTGRSLGPPLSGLIFDKTSNYDLPFILSGALGMLASGLILITAILHIRKQRKLNKTPT